MTSPPGRTGETPGQYQQEEVDQQLAFTAPAFAEPCTACGHRMIRFRGQCWSDCGWREGKHARDEAS